MQDDLAVFGPDTDAVLTQMRALGVDRVRVAVRWLLIAPDPGLAQAPPWLQRELIPAAYPAANWAGLDRVVTEATKLHLDLNFNVVGGAPLWATGGGAPRDGKPHYNWAPKGREYGAFVSALATRYSGTYDPTTHRQSPGDPNDLPAVHFWSIWNEPDYGPSLAPQGDPRQAGHSSIERSPWNYRNLLDGAWTRAAADRSRARHDPHRRGRAPWWPAEQARAVQRHDAAAVRARALLRRHPVPRTPRTRGGASRLPDERRRVSRLPRAPPGPVPGQRVCRSRLFPLVSAERRGAAES